MFGCLAFKGSLVAQRSFGWFPGLFTHEGRHGIPRKAFAKFGNEIDSFSAIDLEVGSTVYSIELMEIVRLNSKLD